MLVPQRSLTAKILVAVGLTVAVVISIYTYFVIRVQTAWWTERSQAQNLLTAGMVTDYLEGAMLSGRGEEVERLLGRLRVSSEISRGRIIKPGGTVAFSTNPGEANSVVVYTPDELFSQNRIVHGVRRENDQLYAVAFRPILNRQACHRCHDPGLEYLGAVVLEKSLAPAEAAIVGNRNLLIVYGIVIFLLVGVVLWLLIVRLVSQPVDGLLRQMRRIQSGDLTARVEPQGSDEIGQLADGFNSMVQSLETTRNELHESHEKQIQQAGRLASIGEVASGIAHEIRNPLAGIGSAVEVLAESNTNSESAEVVEEIRQQVNRLNTTLRSLLDFARQREPDRQVCDVADLIKPVLPIVKPQAQKCRVEIIEQYEPGLPPVSVDAQLIQQAVLNIMVNAIQAMDEGGTLTVSAAAKDVTPSRGGNSKTVRIQIQDTGPGIPTENLMKIFSPFFTTKHRGTGLGLAITRSIIEKHDGRVSVDSKVGAGSIFTLEFAAAESENRTDASASPESQNRVS